MKLCMMLISKGLDMMGPKETSMDRVVPTNDTSSTKSGCLLSLRSRFYGCQLKHERKRPVQIIH